LRRARALEVRPGGSGALTLRSPVDGVVVTLNASMGAGVNQGDVIARVVKSGPQLVDVAVAPSEVTGTAYEVQIGDQWLPARLIAAGGRVEDGMRSDRLSIEGGQARALPGATVPVRVARQVATGVVVPESAIVPVPGGELVFVEVEQRFAPRLVTLAARFGGKVRLASGVTIGEPVVVAGAMGLRGETLRFALNQTE
jgi:multidrug efflux pump subunit AcrA (membrane-fusion protein)